MLCCLPSMREGIKSSALQQFIPSSKCHHTKALHQTKAGLLPEHKKLPVSVPQEGQPVSQQLPSSILCPGRIRSHPMSCATTLGLAWSGHWLISGPQAQRTSPRATTRPRAWPSHQHVSLCFEKSLVRWAQSAAFRGHEICPRGGSGPQQTSLPF